MKDVAAKLTFGSVPTALISTVWPDVKNLLGPSVATSRGKFELAHVLDGILRGELALWVVMEDTTPVAAITTRIIQYPTRRALALDWIGGTRMHEWLPMAQETMERFAKDNSCTHLEGYGRKAWGRVLQRHGWEPEYIAYRMELSDEQGRQRTI